MCDSICKILKTEKTGQNEFIDLSISISYGDYIYNILKFYYCFPDSLIILVMKLVMAWILRGSNDDLLVSEVNELLSMIFGTNRTTG